MPGRMSDFTQLALECNVPATIVALLGSFDASLLVRSGTSVQEQEDFITDFIDAASITDVAEKFLARASLRLLYSKCRLAEGLPSLNLRPLCHRSSRQGLPAPAQERGGRPHLRFPRRGKKAGQQSLALRKRFRLESALKKTPQRSSWTVTVSPVPGS